MCDFSVSGPLIKDWKKIKKEMVLVKTLGTHYLNHFSAGPGLGPILFIVEKD